MTNNEQVAAILRLVKHRSECKKRKAALESELRAAGRSLFEIGGSLRNVQGTGSFNETPAAILPQIVKAPEICSLDRVKTMLEELASLELTLNQLNRSAEELDVD